MRTAIVCLGVCTLAVTALAVEMARAHFVRERPTLATNEPRDESSHERAPVAPTIVFGGVPAETIAPTAVAALPDSIGAVPEAEPCPLDPNELAERPDCPMPREIDVDEPHVVEHDGRTIVVASSIYIF